MMAAMRSAIAEGRFEAWRAEMRRRWTAPAGDQLA
jgi:queuine/archaeosine tRNA-ribosyltransferase